LRDEPHDAGKRGLVTGAGHLCAERSGAVHGSSDQSRARFFPDRTRFPRDRRLTDVTVSLAEAEFAASDPADAMNLLKGVRLSQSDWNALKQYMPLKYQQYFSPVS